MSANVSPQTSQHLIAAGAIVRVQQDDLVGFVAIDLAGVAKADQVFGVLAAVLVADTCLAHHEGQESLLTKFRQHGGRRDVAVPLGTAFVRCFRKDRRHHGANLVVQQRTVRAQYR